MDIEKFLKELVIKVKRKRENVMNRIRYVKDGENGRLKSVKTYNHESNGARYNVVLEPSTSSWYVVDAEGGAVAATGQETSFHKVKKAAKTALETLGIVFKPEARVKRVSHLHLVNGETNVLPQNSKLSGETNG